MLGHQFLQDITARVCQKVEAATACFAATLRFKEVKEAGWIAGDHDALVFVKSLAGSYH